MKKLAFILVLGIFAAINFSSCKAKTDTPEKVVAAFLNYLSDNDFEKAIAISTPETAELLKEWQKEGFNLYKDSVIENVECEMISDTEAECSFYADGSRAMIDAIKIDGKWKVHMEK